MLSTMYVGCWKCDRHSWWSIWLAWRCCPGAIFCVRKGNTHKHNKIKSIWRSFPVAPLYSLLDPLGNSVPSTKFTPEAGKSSYRSTSTDYVSTAIVWGHKVRSGFRHSQWLRPSIPNWIYLKLWL